MHPVRSSVLAVLLLATAGAVRGAGDTGGALDATKREIRQLQSDQKNKTGQDNDKLKLGVPTMELQPDASSPEAWLADKLKQEKKLKQRQQTNANSNWLIDGVEKLEKEDSSAKAMGHDAAKETTTTETAPHPIDQSDSQYLLKLFDEQKKSTDPQIHDGQIVCCRRPRILSRLSWKAGWAPRRCAGNSSTNPSGSRTRGPRTWHQRRPRVIAVRPQRPSPRSQPATPPPRQTQSLSGGIECADPDQGAGRRGCPIAIRRDADAGPGVSEDRPGGDAGGPGAARTRTRQSIFAGADGRQEVLPAAEKILVLGFLVGGPGLTDPFIMALALLFAGPGRPESRHGQVVIRRLRVGAGPV